MLVPLLSPQGWDYMLLLALPVFACLIDRFDAATVPSRTAIVTGFALTSFTIFDLLGRAVYGRLMELSVVTVGAVLLLAAAAALRWRGHA
jgi:hypothetical protein